MEVVRGGEVERWRSYEAVGSVTVLYAASKYSTCRSSLVSFSFTCASLNRVDTSARYIRDGNEKSEEERREERGERGRGREGIEGRVRVQRGRVDGRHFRCHVTCCGITSTCWLDGGHGEGSTRGRERGEDVKKKHSEGEGWADEEKERNEGGYGTRYLRAHPQESKVRWKMCLRSKQHGLDWEESDRGGEEGRGRRRARRRGRGRGERREEREERRGRGAYRICSESPQSS